ncbi:DUF1150 family protein [Cognatishimia activa]|uniref:Putative small protein n=1 Tax=Cognatishimia activa TaxID=1715691 RepID=A0A0P1J9S5_9RHOB|nr:DUF1150 family protein [Cognatishimia activa]MEE2943731.1 DUF1150 family protein [Pseudomonadota bacterium]CUI63721.1 putative small protein [Cognatishimia activa]CUK26367.1 putative small protein [Cognatishimia activa]
MESKFDIDALTDDRMVYIREIDASDLPAELQEEVEGAEHLYAVHAASDGERLAVVKERGLAFALARQNDYAPVTVH